jgi:hypothetical protein
MPLRRGHEWEDLECQINTLGLEQWVGEFGGEGWRDNTRIPAQNQTIHIGLELRVGESAWWIPITQVLVEIPGYPTMPIRLLI